MIDSFDSFVLKLPSVWRDCQCLQKCFVFNLLACLAKLNTVVFYISNVLRCFISVHLKIGSCFVRDRRLSSVCDSVCRTRVFISITLMCECVYWSLIGQSLTLMTSSISFPLLGNDESSAELSLIDRCVAESIWVWIWKVSLDRKCPWQQEFHRCKCYISNSCCVNNSISDWSGVSLISVSLTQSHNQFYLCIFCLHFYFSQF